MNCAISCPIFSAKGKHVHLNLTVKWRFLRPAIHAIHYTAYTTEGRTYVPWLKKQVTRLGGVFKMRTLASIEEVRHAHRLRNRVCACVCSYTRSSM